MLKIISFLCFSLLLLSGCGLLSSNNYNGLVAEKKSYSFILMIPVDDPEAESPAYEVKFTENTSFEGEITSFEQLEEGDRVKVWMEETQEELLSEGVIVASKVVVQHENN